MKETQHILQNDLVVPILRPGTDTIREQVRGGLLDFVRTGVIITEPLPVMFETFKEGHFK
jgi:hypothetical protein